jgi:two-component system sensor histidine kinase BaeS
VLANLIDNAVRHTPEGGAVRIRAAAAAEGRVAIEVEDTGEGIPAEDLPRVFDRFYRIDASRARASGGSGLGLAIVRALVEAMDGSVSVQSTPGQGACFRLELPAAGGEPDPAEG